MPVPVTAQAVSGIWAHRSDVNNLEAIETPTHQVWRHWTMHDLWQRRRSQWCQATPLLVPGHHLPDVMGGLLVRRGGGGSSITSPPHVNHEGGRVAATDVTLHLGATTTGFFLHHRRLTFVVEYLDKGVHWRGLGHRRP
jgi:hypothetical protein